MAYSNFPKTHSLFTISICIVFVTFPALFTEAGQKTHHITGVFDVHDYGAVGDGNTLDTKAIQSAIDDCTKAGGGKVYIHNGTFLTGTIYLKDNVTLYIESGAILLASTNVKDYTKLSDTIIELKGKRSVIYAEKAKNMTIAGRGTINGRGEKFWKANEDKKYGNRPYILFLFLCKDITVKDTTFLNSAKWVQRYLECENINIDGITINSRVNNNNDGIDIDSSEKVRISNCNIFTGDDSICLKASEQRIVKDVTITNCIISSRQQGIKFGSRSTTGFERISISNCTIYGTNQAAIQLLMLDGGILDGVTISNININTAGAAISIDLGDRSRYFEGKQRSHPGALRNIIISNIQAVNISDYGCYILGLPGYPAENITLENIRIKFKGGGTTGQAMRKIPDHSKKYPDYSVLGKLSAYGFYIRDVKNIKLHNIQLDFEVDDARPALVFENVKDLDIFGFDAKSTPQAHALIWLNQVDGAFIHGCRPQKTDTAFLHISGEESNNITVINNDLSRVKQVLKKDKGIDDTIIFIDNNRQG